MSIVALDDAGRARSIRELERGGVVVVPFPSPLPYAVVSTDAAAVNRSKGRPEAQALGSLVRPGDPAWQQAIDLPADVLRRAIVMGVAEGVNLLLPVQIGEESGPGWVRDAAHGGVVGVTVSWRADTMALGEAFSHLFVSSANRSGGQVAVTAGEAAAAFPAGTLVLDGDADRDPDVRHGSATMVAVHAEGTVTVARRGIHDVGYPDAEQYRRSLQVEYGWSA